MGTRKYSSEEFAIRPFRDLKKILKKNKKRGNTPRNIPAEGESVAVSDDDIFRDAMKEVEEIREFRELPVYQKRKKSEQTKREGSSDCDPLKILEEIVSGKRPVHLPDTPEYIEWINPSYRDDITRKLHEGRYAVQDTLDLHGIVLADAEREVDRFISNSIRNGLRCIKIIHGRGLRSPRDPVLKTAVVKWLLSRYRKKIIAFVSARQCDGGLGALYILLP